MVDEKEKQSETAKPAAPKSYSVAHPVLYGEKAKAGKNYHGKRYLPGSKIVLDAAEAKPLLESGHIKE